MKMFFDILCTDMVQNFHRDESDETRNELSECVILLRKEMAEIIAAAKVGYTYLKAPNNADSNLCEEDWALVRTSCFKQKYGDWEKSYKKNFLLYHDVVKQLSGKEFERVPGKNLTELVSEFFVSIGGIAMSPLFGKVILDRNGADDSFAHGIGRNKAIAYAAVKEVIEQGVLIDFDKNHKNRNYDSAVLSAPIEIAENRWICSVVITKKEDNRFYLHEVVEQKKLSGEGSNTVLGQPQHPKAFAKILHDIVSASDMPQNFFDENGEPRLDRLHPFCDLAR
ncbi:MAG: hypothetical protein J6V16_09380 [Bacteroidales bacterium]|nr:hypothetical protein [Bacteroidales bacterium]